MQSRWLSQSLLPHFCFVSDCLIYCDRVSNSTIYLLRALNIAQGGLKRATVLLNIRITGFAMPSIQNCF